MLRILDKLFLFAMCSYLIFQLEGDYRRVVIFIIGLIVAALTLYIENRKVIGALLIAMAVLCLIEPGFTFLLPLVFFDSFWFGLWWGMGFAILFFYALPVYQPWMTAIWLFLSLAAVLLAYCTRQATELKRNLIRLRDTSTELSLVMREKNRKLLEEQDTEIYMATLKERNRIAREIHDNVGHMLSRAILQMGALSTVYEEEPLHGQLLKVNDTLNLAMNNIRESVHDLHDDSVDLKQAILEATREMKQHYHLDLEYDMSQNVPRKVKYCFIAAVKEAMSNIVKYSNGDHIEIVLREHPALYQMTIEDNGTDEEKQKKATEQMREEKDDLKSAAGGMGLSNMRERVESLGGSIHVNCEKGFKIFISIRKKEEAV